MADDACPASTGEGHYPLNDRLSGQSVVGDEKAVTTQYGEVARRIAEGKIRGITLRELKNRKIHETTHEFWMSPDAFYATRKIYIGVKR